MEKPANKSAMPIRILLVEDNDAHTKLILRAMQEDRLANPVDCVRDGEEALDYLFRRGAFEDPSASPRPDMILLDLKLPKIDGLEVLKTIKEDEKLREIPVVVLTSSTDARDVSDGLSSLRQQLYLEAGGLRQVPPGGAGTRLLLDHLQHQARQQDPPSQIRFVTG